MECRSGNNPRLKYFVKLLAAQDSDTAQQDERRRRRLKGVHGSRCRHDLKWQRLGAVEPSSPSLPLACGSPAEAPARVSICASAWSTFCDGDTSLWTWTETPRATEQPQFSCRALSDTCHLLCAWPCDVPAIRALCFIIVSRSVMSHFSARLISTRVSNSTHGRFWAVNLLPDYFLLNAPESGLGEIFSG